MSLIICYVRSIAEEIAMQNEKELQSNSNARGRDSNVAIAEHEQAKRVDGCLSL